MSRFSGLRGRTALDVLRETGTGPGQGPDGDKGEEGQVCWLSAWKADSDEPGSSLLRGGETGMPSGKLSTGDGGQVGKKVYWQAEYKCCVLAKGGGARPLYL